MTSESVSSAGSLKLLYSDIFTREKENDEGGEGRTRKLDHTDCAVCCQLIPVKQRCGVGYTFYHTD